MWKWASRRHLRTPGVSLGATASTGVWDSLSSPTKWNMCGFASLDDAHATSMPSNDPTKNYKLFWNVSLWISFDYRDHSFVGKESLKKLKQYRCFACYVVTKNHFQDVHRLVLELTWNPVWTILCELLNFRALSSQLTIAHITLMPKHRRKESNALQNEWPFLYQFEVDMFYGFWIVPF